MSLTSIAAAWVLSWLCTRRLGRSAVTSSLPTSATIQETCFRLQSWSGSLRYSRERKTQPHLLKEPPLPSDDRRHPLHGLRKTLSGRMARKAVVISPSAPISQTSNRRMRTPVPGTTWSVVGADERPVVFRTVTLDENSLHDHPQVG